jgi:hypothetical protein
MIAFFEVSIIARRYNGLSAAVGPTVTDKEVLEV